MSGLLQVTLLRVAMLAVLVFAAAAMLSQVLPARVLPARELPARVLPAMVNTAHANGASTLLYDQTQGRYRLVVGIIPARPVIPQTHLSMQVFDAAADRVLRDTDIRVLISASGPAGSRQVKPREVVNDVSIVYFETNVAFDVVGPWQVLVEISSDQGGGILSDTSGGWGTGRQHPVGMGVGRAGNHRGGGDLDVVDGKPARTGAAVVLGVVGVRCDTARCSVNSVWRLPTGGVAA